MLKFAIGLVVLLVLSAVAFVVDHEHNKSRAPRGPAIGEHEEIATISTGERVDIQAHVPGKDLTIVEFTAAF